jgi:tetratricopeptide (TPR) repeat protein
VPGPSAVTKFEAALAEFVEHDAANDWDGAACASVAAMFESAATSAPAGRFAAASYDAGLAYERCNDDDRAVRRLEEARAVDPSFDAAVARLAIHHFKHSGDRAGTILQLEHAIELGQFKNVGALVDLASLQIARDSTEDAKLNLQRALAIDDGYMPAANQLALYYLKLAKRRAGGKKRATTQELELAALVCSQAITRSPSYAPIHNTAGLIMNELGQTSGAASEFATAARLDPHFYEANMNYAALNLSFRGFEAARKGYAKALERRPNDYDAHLGLATALHGLLTEVTGDEPNVAERLTAIEQELDAAKKSDPERPEAYFNLGVVQQELETRAARDQGMTLAALDRARASFEQFLEKARGKADYDGAAAAAHERLKDIALARAFVAAPAGATPSPPP